MLGMMRAYRISRKYYLIGKKRRAAHMMKFFGLLYSCHLTEMVDIGEGTELGYNGLGCVIHNDCIIGQDCLISQNVTLGGREFHDGVPTIGNNVKIGAGACILGGVTIGNHVIIGANAVVVNDIENYCIVAGVPAKVIRVQDNENKD